ncbi:hypothetical protein [Streptomyces sp. NPDC055287]
MQRTASLLPIADSCFDVVADKSDGGALGFWGMPGGFCSAVSGWSAAGPGAHLEAD